MQKIEKVCCPQIENNVRTHMKISLVTKQQGHQDKQEVKPKGKITNTPKEIKAIDKNRKKH